MNEVISEKRGYIKQANWDLILKAAYFDDIEWVVNQVIPFFINYHWRMEDNFRNCFRDYLRALVSQGDYTHFIKLTALINTIPKDITQYKYLEKKFEFSESIKETRKIAQIDDKFKELMKFISALGNKLMSEDESLQSAIEAFMQSYEKS
ncbi:MAG: hypothetical protein INQ03_21280 [Candidatus Heimdallarchaeota archaeon]|nr:hypothetical protein [Candidatus Heimdallarchaeota archaeon]